MDIWQWVHQRHSDLIERGQKRLADLIYQISNATCDDRHQEVDFIFPEALSLSRQQKDKELELYFRHWNLQSQVLRRNNVVGMLDESVDLLAFSHQEDVQHCPQRVCAVQDLAAAYGIKDGPGYVAERIAVCEEIESQIDPNWPCFECITVEHVSALLDSNNAVAAKDFIERQRQVLISHGKPVNESELTLVYAECLRQVGDLASAREILADSRESGGGETFRRKKGLLTALVEAQSGNKEAALASLIDFDQVLLADTYFLHWTNAVVELINQKAYECDQVLIQRLHLLADRLQHKGAIRQAITIDNTIIKLSSYINLFCPAKLAHQRNEELLPLLNADLGANETHAANAQLIAKIKSAAIQTNDLPPDNLTSDSTVSNTEKNHDEESFSTEQLYLKYIMFEDQHSFDSLLSAEECFTQYSRTTFFHQKLKQSFYAIDESQRNYFDYGRFLLNKRGASSLVEEFELFDLYSLSDDNQLDCFWLLGIANESLDTRKAVQYFTKAQALNPESSAIDQRLANAYVKTSQFEEAQLLLQKVVEADGENSSAIWDLLMVATANEDWALARQMSSALEFELSNDVGPFIEEWETILIQIRDKQGQTKNLWANRTGPVTAEIVSVLNIGEPQYFGHQVVFSPAPLNTLDIEDENGDRHDNSGCYYYIYPLIKTLNASQHFAFAIDGFYPGDANFAAFKQSLLDENVVFSVRSSEEYEIYDPDKKQRSRGIYVIVLVSIQDSEDHLLERLVKINDILLENVKAFDRPIIWPLLVAKIQHKLGSDELLREQAEIEKKFGLE